jgi:peptide/nickel transport system substrate-binding protein
MLCAEGFLRMFDQAGDWQGVQMRSLRHSRAVLPAVLILVLVGCQAPPRPTADSPGGAAPVSTSPKRVTAVIMGDPPHFAGRFNPSIGSVPGLDSLEEMVNAGMANFDADGALRSQLAEAVPSLENGLWKLLPDGRMETTWKVRAGAAWHDGVPVTSDDLVFTARADQERQVPGFGNVINTLIDRVEAPDAATFVVTWKEPFIGADTLFTRIRGLPLPRHILEEPYYENRTAVPDHPYWGHQFVGTGPYKLRELVSGSHLLLDANDKYVLGRPKIDVVEVKFTPDANVLITTILANAAELTLGARLSIDQALQVQDGWRDGAMTFSAGGWLVAMPQLLNPSPQLLLDVRLRRALQHAIDRQVIVDSLLYGKTTVADTSVGPNERDFKDIESAIPRYPYDPQRVTQLIGELGYTRGADGMLEDGARQRLTIEARSNNQLDTQVKALAIVSDYWKRSGVTVDEVIYGLQRVADREYRHTRPGFEILGFGLDPESFANFHSKQTPLPETGFLGQNRTRYQNAEYDALVDSYFVTIPRLARLDVLRRIVQHFGEQLILLPLAYTTNHVAIGSRLRNVTSRGPNRTEGWNAEQWDLAG